MKRQQGPRIIMALIVLVFVVTGLFRVIPFMMHSAGLREGLPAGMPRFSMQGVFLIFIGAWVIFALTILFIVFSRLFKGKQHEDDERYRKYYDRDYETEEQETEPGLAARLRELDRMKRDGLISQEEYAQKRKEILESL